MAAGKLYFRALKIVILTAVYSIVFIISNSSGARSRFLPEEQESGRDDNFLTVFESICVETGKPEPVNREESPSPPPVTEQAAKADPIFTGEVQSIVDEVCSQYPLEHPFGLYIQELQTGYEFGIHENLTCYDETDGNTDGYFRAASVVKLLMAYAAFRLVEKGEINPSQNWIDPVTRQKLSFLPAIRTMISRSDNDLFNSMLRFIGRDKVNATLREYGIMNSPVYGEINPAVGYSRENNLKRHGTAKVGGKITPGDIGLILRSVYSGKAENPYMNDLNEALLENIYDSRIPRGIGKKYPVAHKTGTSKDFGVYNDAGIIYGENPFVLVVLTKGEKSSRAQAFIRELSGRITDYMDSRKKEEPLSPAPENDEDAAVPRCFCTGAASGTPQGRFGTWDLSGKVPGDQ